jgi:hypothetical protein
MLNVIVLSYMNTMAFSTTILRIMSHTVTLSITYFHCNSDVPILRDVSIMTFSKMTLSIMTLSLMSYIVTLGIKYSIDMLNVIYAQ